jgi:undecaprenyl-diphosphatase
MLNEIILAILQAVTEFLPISSSGHLALVSNIISKPNLFFFTALHLASLLAVLIFTRKEIKELLTFKQEYKTLWTYLIIATIPAVVVALLFGDFVRASFSSFLIIGICYLFTSGVLFLTKFTKPFSKLNWKNSLFIGLFQALALFPGVSRSGMTISSALFSGIDREKAVKFSFLLFIPLGIAAFLAEFKQVYFSASLLLSFLICFVLSLVFLNLLMYVVKKRAFWLFSIYCFLIGVLSLILHFQNL